jgi:PiT family inorganic phosphate transporter
MIGSVLGVGLANQLMMGGSGMDGVDWESVLKVIRALIFSPIIGFVGAAMLFGLCKLFLRDPKFFKAPEGDQPPPWPVRALLILTCTGVSYAHGSNDGQKGMGLIMLILVGSVPTAYALNHAVDERSVQRFVQVSTQVADSLSPYVPTTYTADPGRELERFVSTRKLQPETVPALQSMIRKVSSEITGNGSLAGVPAGNQGNVRNQMYLVSGTLRLLPKYGPKLPDGASAQVWKSYKGFLDSSTLYIPIWVKVTVALTLGLGTMVGWKRIVVTVGEKIGKQHLTYAQGAAAELMAMATILGADRFGLPVSTTHVLSSGVAGAMAANGSGLQRATVRNIALAWFFTLPVSALLSGVLFWAFQHIHVSL